MVSYINQEWQTKRWLNFMQYKVWSPYYVPKSKKELLKAILPTWNGSKTELREHSIQRLRAEFHTLRQKTIDGLMKKTTKPTTVYLIDAEIPFKSVVVTYQAVYAWLDGVKYRLPLERWQKELEMNS